jgi:hypothetical protein
MSRHARWLIASTIVATFAFAVYARTLLPGVDLGDTGGFQAAVAWPEITARQAYPLYFGLARPFVAAVSAGNPARGLNLFSALWAAAAVGLLAWTVAAVTGSTAGGIAAGLFLAFSYTFWTQAVIAEVYTLHLALIGACLAALHAFAARPSRGRLAVFLAVYALSFGNHLSGILLFGPFAAFLLMTHPQPRELFRPRVLVMTLLIAGAGALQYLPSLLAVWSSIEAPAAWRERLAAFWFDVTKVDWRAIMVLGVDPSNASERIGMWAWDGRQQFGVAGVLAAAAGAWLLWRRSRPWATLVVLAYVLNTGFAVTYNVGDAHVFFLPGHFFTAFAIGAAVAASVSATERARRVAVRAAVALIAPALIAYAGWRGWDAAPAADRSGDRRAEQLIGRTLAGLTHAGDLLVARMNWDQESALLYVTRFARPEVSWVRLLRVFPHFPALVADNQAIGRDVVLTADAAASVVAAYGSHFPLVQDQVPATPPLSEIASRIPRGAPYVLTVLTPVRAHPLDRADLAEALRTLTAGRIGAPSDSAYQVIAGLAGEPPGYRRSSARPWRERISLLGDEFTIRMDAWLPTDTFRRGGFGHVLRGRERALFIERGVSLVWYSAADTPETAYAGGPYAVRPRLRLRTRTTQLAALATTDMALRGIRTDPHAP